MSKFTEKLIAVLRWGRMCSFSEILPMRNLVPALVFCLASALPAWSDPVTVELKNDTFQSGSDGLPLDWKAYPPPNGAGTKFEAGTNGGLTLIDSDNANGLGVGQWIKIDGGNKYRATLTTEGAGGVLFLMDFTPSVPGKMAMINKIKVLELKSWVDGGQTGVLEGVAPAEATNAWVWVYSPKATKSDARVLLKSIKVEDLGAAPAESVPVAATPAAEKPVAAANSSPVGPRPASETIPAGMIEVMDFETGDLSQARTQEGGKKEVVSAPEPVRGGKHALKVMLTHDQHRTEVTSYRSPAYGEAKYGWSIYVPKDFDAESWFSIVTQWHTWGSGKNYTIQPPGPPSCLTITKGDWQFKLLYQDGDTDKATQKYFPLGPVDPDRGKWTDFTMEVNWQSPQSGGGYLRLYKNGVKVIDYQGPTWFAEKTDGPYWKMGIYKGGGSWKGEESGAILYFDEARMGGPGATLEDVDPAKQAAPAK